MNKDQKSKVLKRLAILRSNMESILETDDVRATNYSDKIVKSVIRHVTEIEDLLIS